MKFFFPLAALLVLLHSAALAQPANNDCENAIVLSDIVSWCSNAQQYTNVGATPSGYGPASCFSGAHNDVWFAFTPVALDVTVTVIGNQSQAPGGSLNFPEVALYTGTCGGVINEEQCETDFFGNDIIELYKGGLQVGVTYYIRVQGRNGNTGSFQLCINNYNPPVNPGSDCFTAAVLCNKDPFVVQQVSGPGADPTEANDAPCLNLGGNVESNSTWFVWTALNNGPLTFTLTPLNPTDDLDFVVYELPNGPQNCQGKIVLRCMASGDFFYPSPCMGPTGLSEDSDDLSEPAGCSLSTQDNFLAALQMEQGKTYALMVNNFSGTGNGFEIEFGGSGEFVGPETNFTISEPDLTLCIGQPVTFTDATSFPLGTIEEWKWNFGQGASIASSSAAGPHTVSYETPGLKSIVLTVTTDRGCIDTRIQNVLVECCDGQFTVNADIQDVLCTGDATGAIDLTVTNNFGPYGFTWSNDQNTEDINNLLAGGYTVTITDEASCDTVLTYTVNSPPPIEVGVSIVKPTCSGGTDGSVTLAASGGTPPFQYNWNNTGFSNDNTLAGISQGDYTVIVRDANGCEEELLIPVRELELELDPSVTAFTPPSCTGFSDASIIVVISNGLPPYQYDFNDGNGYVGENALTGLTAGTYSVNVLDANLCQGFFTFEIQDPPPLQLDFEVVDASCNGIDDGSIAAIVSGGTGAYTYAWSNGADSAAIDQIPPGSYSLTVTDEKGCEIVNSVRVIEPDPVFIEVAEVTDLICFGDSTGVITVAGAGGTPPYEFSLDGETFQSSATFSGLKAGDYVLTIRDGRGCKATVEAFVDQPPALIVDAGPNQIIQLGYTADLQAVSNDATVSFQWLPVENLSCADCPSTTAFPVESTTYLVTITDLMGCIAVDSVRVLVVPDRPLHIPNAFSPNSDGINDFFTVFGGPAARGIKTLKVFNRWGGLLYDGENLPIGEESVGWDGKFRGEPVNPGVYTYFAEVEFIDGVTVLFKGDVTVLR